MLALGAALGGCAAPVVGDVDASQNPPDEGRYGLVVLTHEFAEPGVEVSGQLLAYDGQSRGDALHALAVPVQAWLTKTEEVPGCRRVIEPFTQHGQVDLLSAGVLTVTAPAPLSTEMNVAPSDFPALRFSLTGVVYDANAPEALPYLAGGAYQLAAPGEETGALSGVVVAAPPIWIVEARQAADGLHVRWGGDGPAQVVVARDGAHSTVGIVCGGDGNELTIPIEDLWFLGPGAAEMAVARVTRAPLAVVGLDAGDAVFVSRDTAQIELVDRDPSEENEENR